MSKRVLLNFKGKTNDFVESMREIGNSLPAFSLEITPTKNKAKGIYGQLYKDEFGYLCDFIAGSKSYVDPYHGWIINIEFIVDEKSLDVFNAVLHGILLDLGNRDQIFSLPFFLDEPAESEKKRRGKYTKRIDVYHRISHLITLRKQALDQGKPPRGFAWSCMCVHTDPRTVKDYFPALEARWDDPDYDPSIEFGDFGDFGNY
jgi:hypothetical protein